MAEQEIGKVTDFFARPVVAAVALNGPIRVGDRLHVVGHTTDLEMTVESMQIEHEAVQEASAGQEVAIKVPDRVRKGDTVYRVAGE